MRGLIALILVSAAHAQTPALRPLHVTAGGAIADDTGKPLILRGLNRSATGSGNADANAADRDYAAQNQLLSMNAVRIFVNASWWNGNVNVPIGGLAYRDYIDSLIQRAKKYGNYVLILKAGQFPDPPCGADGKNCPAPDQGDQNCKSTPSVCGAQDTTGNTIDAAFLFWGSFAKMYAADPSVLYDTWEDMHGIAAAQWSDNQNQLIAAIRAYNPQALIFMEDAGGGFEAIAAGTLPDLAWPNIVWSFHLFSASSGACVQAASPRYANWPGNFEPLAGFAQQHGHGVAIAEWGGCNDAEPYHTNIVNFAKLHSIALIYMSSTDVLSSTGTSFQLTAFGAKVAQAYLALAALTSTAAPALTLVANAEGDVPVIAPNTWVEIKGTNLAPAGDSRIWQSSDFFGNRLPAQLDGVSAAVNGKNAFVYYISPTQVNILTPPDAMQGTVQVTLTNAGVASSPMNVQAQALAPSFFIFNGGPYVTGEHTNGNLLGPASLFPGSTTPAKPGETVVLFANGFGATATPIVSGAVTQSGSLPTMPVIRIGGVNATVLFAGLVAPGEFQINLVVPSSLADGDHPITASYNGATTQAGVSIAVQK